MTETLVNSHTLGFDMVLLNRSPSSQMTCSLHIRFAESGDDDDDDDSDDDNDDGCEHEHVW